MRAHLCRATLSLVALLIVPTQVQGQGSEPTPAPQPARTAAATEGSVVLDVFADAACASFSYTIAAWERRCTALGSRAQPAAAAFYSAAQVQCAAPQGQPARAELRVFNTTAATAGQCDASTPSTVLTMTLNGGCAPLGVGLTGFYRLRAATCTAAPEGTVFTLRSYAAAGCSGSPLAIDSLHTGSCTLNGFQGAQNATLEPAASSASAFNVLSWAAPSAGCSAGGASAQTLVLAVPPQPADAAASTGCTAAALPPGTFVTLRAAPLYTPPNAGTLVEPFSSLAVAAIILAALAVLGLGFYVLLRNNLLCRAAPVQAKAQPQRRDVTATKVPANVRNPVEQRGGGGGAAAMVVPNVLNAAGAGIKEFK
jgi:hypothetical protein